LKKCFPVTLILCLALLTSSVTGIFAASGAPIAQNLELTTYRGTSVGGRLSATDPEGGAVTYLITTQPIKGSLELEESGHFVYTPENGKRGKDYFGYRAVDAEGNQSQEATVIIRIEKQKCRVTYSDLEGKSCAYAAVRLAEEGIFTGECLAGSYVFDTDRPVSRSEFLAQCMKATGYDVSDFLVDTGFQDDVEIEAWAKPYVLEAQACGIITGYETESADSVFEPQREITMAEAAVMLDRAARLTDAVATWYSAGDAVPAWATQAAANLSSCGLLPDGCSFSDDLLTRGDAAILLSNAMNTLANR